MVERITNGSFENGWTGWTSQSGGEDYEFVIDEVAAYTGSYGLYMRFWPSESYRTAYMYVSQSVNLADVDYIRFWVRVPSYKQRSSSDFVIELYIGGSLVSTWTGKPSSWSQYSYYCGSYSSTYTIKLGVRANSSAYDDLYCIYEIDDISAATTGVAPVANFTVDVSEGDVPLTVHFTNTSTGTPTPSYYWTFGDGGTSSEVNPTHEYTRVGTFTATLKATNIEGTDSKSTDITVNGSVPVASFTASPKTGAIPLSVNFTNTSTGTPAPTLDWDFGDGSEHETGQYVTHEYTQSGTFTVTLIATNFLGHSVATDVIHAEGIPSANFEPIPVGGGTKTPITFVNKTTAYPDVFLWEWWFDSAGPYGPAHSTEFQPQHEFPTTGWKSVTLRATNDIGSSTKTLLNCVYIMPDIKAHASGYRVGLLIDGTLIRRTGSSSGIDEITPLPPNPIDAFTVKKIRVYQSSSSTTPIVMDLTGVTRAELYYDVLRLLVQPPYNVSFPVYSFVMAGCDNVVGDLNDIYVTHVIDATGCTGMYGYMAVPSTMKYIYIAGTSVTPSQLDQTLIRVANVTTQDNGVIRTNLNRTSASDSAVASLLARGWSVI